MFLSPPLWFRDYGSIAVLFGAFLEGETILVLAGILAHWYLALPRMLVAASRVRLFGIQWPCYVDRVKEMAVIENRLYRKPRILGIS